MMTEFDDSEHWGFFLTGQKLTSETGKYVRMSSLVLAALRSAGVFSTMEDGTTAPATDKLWLDKNTDPPTLKEWDAAGSSWVPMTYGRLFGQAAVGFLTVTGGTGNAVVVSAPVGFQANRLYLITPTNNNTGAATIQVSGVATFGVKYGDGSNIDPSELTAGRQAVLFFTGARFEVVFPVGDLNDAVTTAVAAAGAASGSASSAATSAANAAAAATAVITGATADDTIADADEVIYKTGTTIKRATLPGLISSIFNGSRKIASAWFQSTFRLWDAADQTKGLGFVLSSIATGTTRLLTMPDRDVDLGTTINRSATVATTSGSAIDFTSIPAGVKRVTANLTGVSTNGTSDLLLQIGPSGGVETSGYVSHAAFSGGTGAGATNGFLVQNGRAATDEIAAVVSIDLADAATNRWNSRGNANRSSGTSVVGASSGTKAIAGALSRLRLTTVGGTDTFDAGSISISWEF
jgi:hypothetical protein